MQTAQAQSVSSVESFPLRNLQKPWAKPAGNPRAATPPRAVSETFYGRRVPSGGPRRHSITSLLPADVAMEAAMSNPLVAGNTTDSAVVTNPINLMDSSLSISTGRSKSPRTPRVSACLLYAYNIYFSFPCS